VFGVGGAIGLVGSGFVLEHLSWHWLFLAGGAPVLVASALIWAFVPESPVRRGGRPDRLGAAVFSAALVCLLLAVTKGEAWGWLSFPVVGLAVASLCWLVVWVSVARRVPEPLIDLRTFGRPGMAWTNAATVLVGFSLTAFMVLMPAFVQVGSSVAGYGFDASLVESGLFFLPSCVAMIVCGPLAGWLGARVGHAVVLRIGLASSAGALTLLAFAHDEVSVALVWMGLLGIGIAFALAAIGTLVIEHSHASETSVSSGVNMIMRTVGASVGAQLAAAVIAAHTLEGALIPDEAGFTIAFALAAGAATLALVPGFALGGRARRLRRRVALSPA